ncbi:MAG: segregation and condensation protein ScpB [Phormidesmis priestleyi Ana]|uniref:Segregation and condensation protein ScpB n=1 Tax=Phormidesmis priestleyi Ana TaxID=1666911 RepID=A0A0P7ZZB0_9CYAN|nr:MAG: segregation and condensation protein ScpB [Phormidesmis priestleyi Ana]
MARLANTIEAILYLKAQPLKIAQIAEFARCDKDSAEEGLIELMSEYAHREGALEIAETEEGYALQLREVFKPLVDSIVPLDIGLGALRTLAAIALRGPIAQNELVELRGSGVYQHVPDLVEQGFIKKRRQSDGRSSWLQITEKFYQHFEIDKLPEITNLRLPKPIEEESQAEGKAKSKKESKKESTAEAIEEAIEETIEEAAPEKVAPFNEEDERTEAHYNAEEIAVLSGAVEPSGGSLLSDTVLEQVTNASESEYFDVQQSVEQSVELSVEQSLEDTSEVVEPTK